MHRHLDSATEVGYQIRREVLVGQLESSLGIEQVKE